MVEYETSASWWDLNDWADFCWGEEWKAGWSKENEKVHVPTKIALIHSEVSEALEGHRKGLMDDHLKHRTAFEVELADVFIRLMALAGSYNLNIQAAVCEKMDYNRSRNDHKKETREAEGGKKY